MTSDSPERIYPMQKPEGHQAAIQRYSSRVDASVDRIRMLVLGCQYAADAENVVSQCKATVADMFGHAGTPLHHDQAVFRDDQGFQTVLTVLYWQDEAAFATWQAKFNTWWAAQDPATLAHGIWVESFSVPPAYRETNVFKEYIRGVSACPMTKISPMGESGYWGAARDRFTASGYDDFSPSAPSELAFDPTRDTVGKRIVVNNIPDNMCVIRSGVTWHNCGPEQLDSYETNLKPKLDKGMDFLRGNPEETGCCSLRQVICLDDTGAEEKEAYSLGIFRTYGHLEKWAHDHPTHLAIYTRALAERKKYQENLELLTYHEIYVLNDDVRCEYLNCHPQTGLLPFFDNTVA
ncbi:phenylacetaldoxime dehydratase family protein [Roseobacter sp.]|uniref:phenylacetaldoxime dehydratase family protein n=1 Tax=Roseobacter sp. TaxID=1907202 RepID=UPI003297F165